MLQHVCEEAFPVPAGANSAPHLPAANQEELARHVQEVLRADAALREHNAAWAAAFKGPKAKADSLLARMHQEVARAKALVSMHCQSVCLFLEKHSASGRCGIVDPSIARVYVRLLGNGAKP